MLATEVGITHALGVATEIIRLQADHLSHFGIAGMKGTGGCYAEYDIAATMPNAGLCRIRYR